jgi:hypothetical protein
MALTSYSGLQTAIASWLERSDTGSYVADWITLAEARINRTLRTERMLRRSSATISDEFSAAPSDFAAPLMMRRKTSPYQRLDFLLPEQMSVERSLLPSGVLKSYALVGTEFWFAPTPTAAEDVELVYYAAIPALSDGNTTNWLLSAHPDVYLRGALLEAALFYEDDEEAAKYEARFRASLADVMAADMRDRLAVNLTPKPSAQAV